nr:MAG: ORF1 [Anelloviridae sp.]
MAWSWWWQRRRRRRPWTRRKWRRLRTRRLRRPLRRRRKRYRVRRRRRWGRRRGRRTYLRRRLKKRKRRKKLRLTQWNPSTIRGCTIKGMAPLIICGHTMSGNNFAIRMEDYVTQIRPFGGSFSTTTWSLKVLWDEHTRFHNTWSYPNTQLDLARFKGVNFYFYRDKDTDFIVTYSSVPPFKIDKYSSAMLHPGMLMQRKKKILIPSFTTRPRGRKKVKVHIKPPVLFEDKWYTQQDLCDVNLLSLAVSAASFRHPFCPPQTDNICITFQVLKDKYYTQMSVTPTTELQEKDEEIIDHLYSTAEYYQTVHTQGIINKTQRIAKYATSNNTLGNLTDVTQYLEQPTSTNFTQTLSTGNNSIYGFPSYNPQKDKLKKILDWFWKQESNKDNVVTGSYQQPTNKYVSYHLGKYSPIFLSSYRTNLQFKTAYTDVTYNPLNDKGKGNQIWVQYVTKPNTVFNEKQCKCHIVDIPLWAAFHGYIDFVQSELGIQEEILNIAIIVVICPYTKPKLVHDPPNENQGFVFYDTQFGDGKMPEGSGLVPIYYQNRWYPRIKFQSQVVHDFILTGPFSYKDDLKSTVLTVEYKFKFLWGGNMIPEQVIRNPCKTEGHDLPHTSRLHRDLQVVDPHTVGPQWALHTWDWRRGLFGTEAIKRVSEQQVHDELYYPLSKKPRFFPPISGLQEQERDYSSQEEKDQSSTEEETDPKKKDQIQQRRLHLQFQEQQRLGKQLRLIFRELQKTQAGLHINPMLSNRL